MEIKSYFKQALNGHVLMVTFFVGLFATVLIGLQQSLMNAESQVKEALGVLVFLQTNVTDTEASQLTQSLKGQDPEIQSVSYTSRDQAYQNALHDPAFAKPLMVLKTNPLPGTLSIRYSDRAWWERDQPDENLKNIPSIQEIRWDPQARSLFRTLHRWRLWCMRFSVFVMAMLGLWAAIGLFRFLSLQSNLLEIASQVVIGLIGGGLAWGLWGLGIHALRTELSPLHPVWMWILPLVMGAIAALGCFGVEIRHAD